VQCLYSFDNRPVWLYQTIRITCLSTEEVQAAEAAYVGGYSYEVSPGEKAALEAAGYTVETI
jgi:hypothetical protein